MRDWPVHFSYNSADSRFNRMVSVMNAFIFYLSFNDGRKLTVTINAYSLLSAVMQARTKAFELINRVWANEGVRLKLTDYMVK